MASRIGTGFIVFLNDNSFDFSYQVDENSSNISSSYTVNSSLPFSFNLTGDILSFDLDSFFEVFPFVGKLTIDTHITDLLEVRFSTINNSIFMSDKIYYFDLSTFCFFKELVYPSVPSSLPSLNGNGCEYIDGTQLNVTGRKTVYTVDRSYMGLLADNSYTAVYDCSAPTGEKLTVPESLLTLYVAPVTTP